MIPKKDSKQLLTESILELLSTNPLEKISITDIVRNCGVSKRTFYNYYKDKYDLANSVYLYLVADYYSRHREKISFRELLFYTAQCVMDHIDFFTHIISYQGQNNFRLYVADPLCELYVQLIEEQYAETLDPAHQKSLRFFVIGTVGFVEERIATKDYIDPNEIVAFFELCCPAWMGKYF